MKVTIYATVLVKNQGAFEAGEVWNTHSLLANAESEKDVMGRHLLPLEIVACTGTYTPEAT